MILPLADIVETAVRLNELDRDMSPIEAHVGLAEDGHADARPSRLPEIYRTVALQTVLADAAYQGVLHVGRTLKDGDGAPGEAAEIVEELRRDHARAVERILALRARLRALDGPLGESAARLRDQPLDERLMRILPAEGDFDIAWAEEQVRRDHHEVADAIAAWRTMHDPRPVMYVAGSSGRDEIRTALNRLTTGGRLALRRSISGPRWSRRSAPLAKAA